MRTMQPAARICAAIAAIGVTLSLFTAMTGLANHYAQVKADGVVSKAVADAALRMLDVDALGLDTMDRKLLLAVMEKFTGGPVGIENLAHAIGEDADTIEDVLEPYLIQQGYLQRTPRGRMAALAAYRHFGLAVPTGMRDLLSESE